ncbi:MAG: tetratricopeptide repeat protein [Thermodesulfobacteriota bacterium]
MRREVPATVFFIATLLVYAGAAITRNLAYVDNLTLWGDAAGKSPVKPRPHILLGSAYFDSGLFDKSADEFELAFSLNPRSVASHREKGLYDRDRFVARVYNNIGAGYLERGMWAAAIAEFEKALRVDPAYARAYNNIGLAYDGRGMEKEAVESYERALVMEPEFLEPRVNLANFYYGKGFFEEAVDEYEKALAIEPRSATAHFNLGLAYMNGLKEYDKALYHFDRALEEEPRSAGAGEVRRARDMLNERISD